LKPKWVASVNRGRVSFENRKGFDGYISQFEGLRVELTIDRIRNNRSNKQNAYYWGVVIKYLSENLGYTPEEAHEAMKLLFLKKHTDGKPDTLTSTTELDTKAFMDYVEQIQVFASTELGIVIPDPNQTDFLDEPV